MHPTSATAALSNFFMPNVYPVHSSQASPFGRLFVARTAIFLILVLATGLRLRGLGHQSLWYDESGTLESARVRLSQVIPLVDQTENTPPFYYILLNRWVRLFGTSDVALRLPSALYGIATVIMLYLIGREALGEPLGLFAAGGLAISRYHIAYSQEARAYALLVLLATVSCYAMVVLARRRRRWAEWVYVLSSAAMLWTQPFGVFVMLGQGLFILTRWRDPAGVPLRRWLILQAAAVLLFAPWIPKAMSVASAGQPWMPMPHVAEAMREYVTPWPALVTLLLLAAVGVVIGVRRREMGGPLGILLLAACVVTPIVLSVGRHSLFTPRYGIAGLIGLYLAAAAGAAALGPKWGSLAIVLACLPTMPGLAHDARFGLNAQVKPDFRGAAQWIESHANAGNVVWCPDYTLVRPLRHYLSRGDLRVVDQPTVSTDGGQLVWLVRPGPLDRSSGDVLGHWQFRAGVEVYELRPRRDGNPATSRP